MKRIWQWLRDKRQHFKGLGALILTVMVLALLMDLVVMPLYTHRGVETELPDVTERSYEEAKSILEKHGFRMVKYKDVFEATYPESTVVQQTPPPYSMVKKGRRIYVTLSAGEKKVTVPSVVGISERDAVFRLNQAGLEVAEDVYYEYDSYRPKGVVKAQSLMEGTEVLEGSTIAITVSNGEWPSRFVVPDLSGKSLSVARAMLRQNGLMLGVVEYKTRKDLIPNTVVEQGLQPGTEVEQNTSVSVVVSKLEEERW